jgi:hypothetical protein
MWRSILAVILLPSLTAAQSAQPGTASANGGQTEANCPTPRRVEPQSTPYTKYNGIRRGKEGEAAVQLVANGFLTTPKSPVSGLVPLRLELQPAEGFTVGKIDYPKPNTAKIQFHAAKIAVVGVPAMSFKVRVDRNASLGIHVLKGTLTFQPVRADTGASPVQQMEVEIPINVVARDASLKRGPWPFYHLPVAVIVVLIVFSPVLVAVELPIIAVCAIAARGGCMD